MHSRCTENARNSAFKREYKQLESTAWTSDDRSLWLNRNEDNEDWGQFFAKIAKHNVMPCHVIEMHTETIWNGCKHLRIFAVEDSRFSASSSVPLRSHGQPVVCYDSQPAIVNYGLQVATASALKPFDMRKFAFSMVSIGILWMVSEGEEKQVLTPLQPPKSSGVSLFHPRLDAVKVPLEKLQMDRQTLAPFSCNGIRSCSPCETWPMWWNISIGSDRQFPSWNFHPRLA